MFSKPIQKSIDDFTLINNFIKNYTGATYAQRQKDASTAYIGWMGTS
ncbi:hypothetical protein NBRC116595_20310 [Aliiglaciecola sp. NS0011-25]